MGILLLVRTRETESERQEGYVPWSSIEIAVQERF